MAPAPSKPETDPALGVALRGLREQQRRTQEDVARGAGITMNALARVERGETDPKWSTVLAICRALGTNVAEVAAQAERSGARLGEPSA